MGCLIVIAGCIISIVVGILTDSVILSLCLILFSCITGTIILTDSNKNNDQLNQKKAYQLKQKAQEAYDRKIRTIVIPDNHYIVDYIKGELNLLKGQQYCWIDEDNSLCLFPCDAPIKPVFMSKVNRIKIPKDNIDFFMTDGIITEEKKTNENGDEELVTYDTRRIIMQCKDDEEQDRTIEFGFNNLSIFKVLLPGKEKAKDVIEEEKEDRVNENTLINEESIQNEEVREIEVIDKTKSISEQIREIAKLKEEGILTEEEFNDKKKVLLNRI